MIYPQEALDEVQQLNDIVDVISSYTSLKQRGSSYVGLCPFHKERTPSFSVSADKQLFHCFGCGESGNVYGFIMKSENLGFMDAVRFLADRAHYSLPERNISQNDAKKKALKEKLFEINKLAARFFYDSLNSEAGKPAVYYLDKRNIYPNIRKRFGLGYSPDKWDLLFKRLRDSGFDLELLKSSGLIVSDKNGYRDKFRNRLMFPIMNAMGEITGFGGRILGDGNIKYLNSPETPIFEKSKNLYGINFARKSRSKEFILVEGYMDVITLHQAGFTNAVASLGTAFNREHARILKKYVQKVILLFDSDSAGVAAALRAIPELESNGIACKVLSLKNAKDPDEFISTYGKDEFAKALSKAAGSVTYKINIIKENYDFKKTEEKVEFITEVSKLLAELPNAVERSAYSKEVSKMSGISEDAVLDEIKKRAGGNGDSVRLPKNSLLAGKKNKSASKGSAEAKRSIICLAAADRFVSNAVEAALLPEQLLDRTYVKLLRIIFEKNKKGADIYPAELVNFFETYEEQKTVANIFSVSPTLPDNKSESERMLTQLVREIIMDYIDYCSQNAQNEAELNKILESKRNLSKLNIKVADC